MLSITRIFRRKGKQELRALPELISELRSQFGASNFDGENVRVDLNTWHPHSLVNILINKPKFYPFSSGWGEILVERAEAEIICKVKYSLKPFFINMFVFSVFFAIVPIFFGAVNNLNNIFYSLGISLVLAVFAVVYRDGYQFIVLQSRINKAVYKR